MTQASSLIQVQGLDAVALTTPDGARAVVLLQGAQLLSWIPAGGAEQLYVSPRSRYACGEAVRGGVPVIFPQFSARGPLPRHGFARNRLWQLVNTHTGPQGTSARLRLTDDASTQACWPHTFALELELQLSDRTLTLGLSCTNTGSQALSFTAALHTYFRVQRLDAVSVQGLAGLSYVDTTDNCLQRQSEEWLHPGGDLDRIYQGVPAALLLREDGGSTPRQLRLEQQGFEDAVVWNPGAEKCAALADMPSDGFVHMLCIEAAQIKRPVQLAPGQIWRGAQRLSLL